MLLQNIQNMNEKQQKLLKKYTKGIMEMTANEDAHFSSIPLLNMGFRFKQTFYHVAESELEKQIEDFLLVSHHKSGQEGIDGSNDNMRVYIKEDASEVIVAGPPQAITLAEPELVFIRVDVYAKKRHSELYFERKKYPDKAMINLKVANGDRLFSRSFIPSFKEIDLDKHYNDSIHDIHKAMLEFIDRDTSGISILHGSTGTGKTNYVLWLSSLFPNKEFVFIDPSAVNIFNLSLEMVQRNYSDLPEDKERIYVFEDCEDLLKRRDINARHSLVSSLLGAIDGPIGKIMRVKAIFTSNLPLADVDPAILRPGRTFGIFHFGDLELKKVQAIDPNRNEPCSLAELYNEKHEEETVKRIGF